MHILSPVTDNESMWPYRVLNPGLLALESDALPTAQRGPALDVIARTRPMDGQMDTRTEVRLSPFFEWYDIKTGMKQ